MAGPENAMYITSDAVHYVQHRSDPMKIDLRTRRLEIIGKAQEAEQKVRIQYASKHANIANAWKKWQGEVLGLERLGTIAEKEAYEAEFRRWAADKPEYATLLDSLEAAYATHTEAYCMEELKNETVRTIEVASLAGRLAVARSEKTTPERRAELERAIEQAYKDFDPAVERALAACVLKGFADYCPAEHYPAELKALIDEQGSVEAYVEHLFTKSVMRSAESWQTATAEELAADPATLLYKAVRNTKGRLPRNLSNLPAIERWYRPFMKALMAFDRERAFFPDANMTLRVSYGSIAGYEYADGEYHTPHTTIDGIIAKDNPAIYDYDIPQSLRDLYASKGYGRWATEIYGRETVPVCFLATNHTTGGNSGSPVLNGKGELVGINFDRTWRSTMSDIEFDPTICRNIAVDIRYVLMVIDRVGGAGYLVEEMGVK